MWRQRLGQFMERMSGRLTPPEITPLDRIQLLLLPVADLFMILMYSRPPGGSLRTARVTLATIWLAAAVAFLVGIPAAAVLVNATARSQPLLIVIGLLGVAVGLGSGTLAVFGVRQRILIAALPQHPSPTPPQRGGDK
jgi:hypothetical protein